MSASPSDIMTTLKNIVLALNEASNIYRQVQGISTAEKISAPTVIKSSPGRVASVSVTTAGSTAGTMYDAVSLTDTTSPFYIIPAAIGTTPYIVNLPTDSGIVVVPGTGQVLTVSFS